MKKKQIHEKQIKNSVTILFYFSIRLINGIAREHLICMSFIQIENVRKLQYITHMSATKIEISWKHDYFSIYQISLKQ